MSTLAKFSRMCARPGLQSAAGVALRQAAAKQTLFRKVPAAHAVAAVAPRYFSASAARNADEEKSKVLESLKTYDQVKAKVDKVCSEFGKISADKYRVDAHFVNDLGLDSLDQVELTMAFESEFGFEIPDVEAEKLQKPIDVIKYICDKRGIQMPSS